MRFRPNIDVRKEMEDSRLNAIECLKLITFVKGQLDFSYKSTTAANVDLTESLLDKWLKNNHITVDIIINNNNFNYEYITFAVCLYFFNCEF